MDHLHHTPPVPTHPLESFVSKSDKFSFSLEKIWQFVFLSRTNLAKFSRFLLLLMSSIRILEEARTYILSFLVLPEIKSPCCLSTFHLFFVQTIHLLFCKITTQMPLVPQRLNTRVAPDGYVFPGIDAFENLRFFIPIREYLCPSKKGHRPQ